MAERLSADVVFIGSGIAAAIAGATLAGAGLKVLFLEAGPRVDRGAAVTRFQMSPTKSQNSPYPTQFYAPQPDEADLSAYYVGVGPDLFRAQQARVVGGTTWHWGGLAMRYNPNDFRMKSRFGVGVDWPIAYDDLEPWYAVAEDEMGVAGDPDSGFGGPRSGPFPMPPVPMTWSDRQVKAVSDPLGYTMTAFPQARNTVWRHGRPQCCGNATCVPICPIQAKYDATAHLAIAERAGARVEAEAVVDRIVIGADGKVRSVHFLRPDRSEGEAIATTFIIACHTIETPKLLLLSAGETVANGVANASDQVGRNLMSQIDVGVQGLTRDPVFNYRGPVTTGGIAEMRDGDFRNERAAIGMSPSNEGWSRAVGPMSVAADYIRKGLRGAALKAAISHDVSRQLIIGASSEMLPDPENRVTLADEPDAVGIARPKIAFRFDDYTRRGFEAARPIQNAIMAGLGATEIKQLGPIADSAVMGGTTRMGDDSKTSVVDKNLRSHDHGNLFIVGSSVLPTITASPPTLTIGALSARLGAYLVKEMKSGGAK